MPEPAVAEGHLARVVGLEALDLTFVEHAGVRCIEGLDDVGDIVVRVVEAAVAGRRFPGFVGIKGVDDQEKAVGVVVVVDPAGGVVEQPGRVVVGLLATKQVVGQVLREEVAPLMRFGQPLGHMAADGVGRQGGAGTEAVGFLAPNPLPLAEAAVKVLAGLELVVCRTLIAGTKIAGTQLLQHVTKTLRC